MPAHSFFGDVKLTRRALPASHLLPGSRLQLALGRARARSAARSAGALSERTGTGGEPVGVAVRWVRWLMNRFLL